MAALVAAVERSALSAKAENGSTRFVSPAFWGRKQQKAGWKPNQPLCYVAEREGFEPSVEYNPHTRLAGEHHRPTRSSLQSRQCWFLAEGVGFEPTVLSHNGFQDRRLKPLGHPSMSVGKYHHTETLSTDTSSTSNECNRQH